MKLRDHRPAASQRGFTLVEVTVVGFILAVSTLIAARQTVLTVDDGRARATGAYLLHLKGGLDGLIAGNFNAYASDLPLTNANGSPKFANPAAPTIAELKQQGHLPASFPSRTPAGQQVRIVISRTASTCPGVGCRIEALAYTTTPLPRRWGQHADLGSIAAAVDAMQGYGGAAWPSNPTAIRGANFEVSNPVTGAGTVGVVGVVAMLDTTIWNQFVRVGDSRDPALQGNLSVGESFSAMRVGMRETVTPNTACTVTNFANSSNPATAALDLDGNVEYARTETGGIAACIGGAWRSIAVVATAGQACGNAAYPEGTTAIDAGNSGLSLLCRDGQWSPLSQWLSRYTIMSTRLAPATLTNAPTSTSVAKPACGLSGGIAGTPGVYAIPQSIQNRGSFALTGTRNGDNIRVDGTMTLDPTNFRATNAGGTWNVAVPANSQAVVITYCTYS